MGLFQKAPHRIPANSNNKSEKAMKKTQATTNPFKYSDTNKRYHTYDYFMKHRYGAKCAKIPLDGGFTCPNIDGRCGTGGCIYCSGRGSGDFAQSPALSVEEQFALTAEKLSSKWKTDKYIAYFQAHTNTYAPVSVLREKFEAALAIDGVTGLNIATRADCLPDDVIAYLAELAERTDLTVELGLQTVNDRVASYINRGHSFEDFKDGYSRLIASSGKIMTCIHLIFGLPGETPEDMLDSVRKVARLRPTQVKIHLLHIIDGTKMAEIYRRGDYEPMDRRLYIETVCRALRLLPPETVICRLTGDGAPDTLLAPDWSRKKTTVINDIDKMMFAQGWYQGDKHEVKQR